MDTAPVEDLEKGTIDVPDTQLPAMVGGGEKEPTIIPDLRIPLIDGGVVAANNKNAGLKKWLLYWVITGSVMVLTNHINAAPKYQLIRPELGMFMVFLCAIYFMLHAMKQVM